MLTRIRKKRAQSSLEYLIIITIILAAFLGMQNYFKRGLSGRWKSAVDDLGDQYDPLIANSDVWHIVESETKTTLNAVPVGVSGEEQTTRTDYTNSVETKTGYISIINF